MEYRPTVDPGSTPKCSSPAPMAVLASPACKGPAWTVTVLLREAIKACAED